MFVPTKGIVQSCVVEEMTGLAIGRLRSRLWMTSKWVLASATTSEAQ